MESEQGKTSPLSPIYRKEWILFLMPYLLMALTIAYLTISQEQASTAADAANATDAATGEFVIEGIHTPKHGVVQVDVLNGGSEEVTIPQVLVDDAYWDYVATPSNTIAAGGVATFTLPYPWVADELLVVRLITSRGETFDGEVVPSLEITATASAQ